MLLRCSESDQVKLVAETCSENYVLDDSVGSLSAFPSKANLKLHNTPVYLKMIVNTISVPDFFKVSNSDCLSVEVLKNYNSEHS